MTTSRLEDVDFGAEVPEIAQAGSIAPTPRISVESQGPRRGEPRTLEAETRMFGDQVVVAVIVQNARASLMRTGGDHDVDRRQTMVAASSQLALGQQGPLFHRPRYLDTRKQQIEFIHHLPVVSASTSRVTGLEEEGKADRELTLLDPSGNHVGPVGWQPASDHP